MPAPRAEHVAADDGRELQGPDEPRRQPLPGRLVERSPEQVPAALERVRHRDEDALAIDQQVRQVVGDEVADGDRQQAGGGRADPDEPGHRQGRGDDDAEEPDQEDGLPGELGQPEQVEPDLGLRQPVEQDRADAERDDHDIGEAPAGLEQTARERPTADAAVLVDERERREPTEQPEPDREDLGVGAPGVAPELGHHRERVARCSRRAR